MENTRQATDMDRVVTTATRMPKQAPFKWLALGAIRVTECAVWADSRRSVRRR
jgi:hypothetical protein